MPNRILREGINSSARINRLSSMAEILYRRLMSVADDYGRFYGSPTAVRGACWPTHPSPPSETIVRELLAECAQPAVNLLTLYEVEGCEFLEIVDFRQRTRSESKFPQPVRNARSFVSEVRALGGDGIRISETETHAESAVRAPQRLAADMLAKTSGKWSEFLDRYPMKVELDAAAQEFISVVTVDNEEQAFGCLQRYLASDQVKRGVLMKPANWLRQQNRDGWKADWPSAAQRNGAPVRAKPRDDLDPKEAARLVAEADEMLRQNGL